MDITFAKKFLQQRADECGFQGQVAIRQPQFVGPVSFVAEYPDGSFVDLGNSVQDAETTIRKLTGQHDTRIKPQVQAPKPEPVAKARKR